MIGGDERMLRLAQLCEKDGLQTVTLGLQTDDHELCGITRADVAVLPYPFSLRAGRIPCLTGLTLSLSDALERVKEDALVVTGEGVTIDPPRRQICFAKDDIFQQNNAELSAEGALACAMKEMDGAVWGARCVVIGYGRLGRALARKLTALGAWVIVAARSEEARRLARSEGMQSAELADIGSRLLRAQAIFNTAPAQVVPNEALHHVSPGALMLELASAPYGYDQEYAASLGIKTAVLPGIPARYAPQEAACALYAALRRAMKEAALQ
ncbi:MAG: dipicolinate synthase subunit DpsA [Eubacteriales bacterium]|nr:dipicolinate synthase subunit DpsA [Eubacteriales bacterium]